MFFHRVFLLRLKKRWGPASTARATSALEPEVMKSKAKPKAKTIPKRSKNHSKNIFKKKKKTTKKKQQTNKQPHLPLSASSPCAPRAAWQWCRCPRSLGPKAQSPTNDLGWRSGQETNQTPTTQPQHLWVLWVFLVSFLVSSSDFNGFLGFVLMFFPACIAAEKVHTPNK